MDKQKATELRFMIAQVIEICVQYPGDADQIEKGFKKTEDWVQRLVDSELLKYVGKNAKIGIKNG
jgi:hypothetical protein